MFRKLVIGALGAMAVLFSTTAFAQGTAADAKAMLEKTVAAIKADKASYNSPKAGADKAWVPKASLVTAVAGLGCGVGYYK